MKLRIIYIYIIHINSIKIIKFQFFFLIYNFFILYNIFIENFKINIFYKMILLDFWIYLYTILKIKIKFFYNK